MANSKLTFKSNYTYNSYLSDCDLLNKYHLTEYSKTPKVKSLIIQLPIKEMINSLESSGKNSLDPDVQLKSFVLLYILNLFLPYVSFNRTDSVGSNKTKGSVLDGHLEIVLLETDSIDIFLSSFFVENWNRISENDCFSFNSLGKKKKIFESNQFDFFSVKISANCIFDVFDFLNKNLLDVNPKDLNLTIKFVFENLVSNLDKKNSIKNIPFFWISG